MVPTASRTAAPPARCRDQSYGAMSIVRPLFTQGNTAHVYRARCRQGAPRAITRDHGSDELPVRGPGWNPGVAPEGVGGKCHRQAMTKTHPRTTPARA